MQKNKQNNVVRKMTNLERRMLSSQKCSSAAEGSHKNLDMSRPRRTQQLRQLANNASTAKKKRERKKKKKAGENDGNHRTHASQTKPTGHETSKRATCASGLQDELARLRTHSKSGIKGRQMRKQMPSHNNRGSHTSWQERAFEKVDRVATEFEAATSMFCCNNTKLCCCGIKAKKRSFKTLGTGIANKERKAVELACSVMAPVISLPVIAITVLALIGYLRLKHFETVNDKTWQILCSWWATMFTARLGQIFLSASVTRIVSIRRLPVFLNVIT